MLRYCYLVRDETEKVQTMRLGIQRCLISGCQHTMSLFSDEGKAATPLRLLVNTARRDARSHNASDGAAVSVTRYRGFAETKRYFEIYGWIEPSSKSNEVRAGDDTLCGLSKARRTARCEMKSRRRGGVAAGTAGELGRVVAGKRVGFRFHVGLGWSGRGESKSLARGCGSGRGLAVKEQRNK